MPVRDKIGGTWRDTAAMWDKITGEWRPVAAAWRKVDGVWRQIFDGVKSNYFKQYTANMDRLTGRHTFTEAIGAMTATVTGYAGGYSNGCQVGWIVENLPAGANVSVEWEYYKAGYAMNDIIITSANGQLQTHSIAEAVTRQTLTTTNHTGWLLFMIDFFPDYTTTTWITIKKITVDGRQVWPAA